MRCMKQLLIFYYYPIPEVPLMNATSAMIAARQAVSFDSESIPLCKIDPILDSTHYSG